MRASLLFLTGVLLSLSTFPDSISIDGKKYDDVYVRETATMYYIQIPSSGETKAFRKETVGDVQLSITQEWEVRRSLLETWKENREIIKQQNLEKKVRKLALRRKREQGMELNKSVKRTNAELAVPTESRKADRLEQEKQLKEIAGKKIAQKPPMQPQPKNVVPSELTQKAQKAGGLSRKQTGNMSMADKVVKTEDEWREILTPDQFYVLRRKGTERPFTNAYYNSKKKGAYTCAACGQTLFSSEHKFDSGTGWPSFWQPYAPDQVGTESDRSLGTLRTEVLCSRCDSHLGHLFNDGPDPTGLRYCINSISLNLVQQKHNME